MIRVLATSLSVIFHPLLLIPYAFLILTLSSAFGFSYLPEQIQLSLWMRIVINTVFFPMIALLLLVALKFVKSVFLRERKERIAPFIIMMFFYVWTTISFVMDDTAPKPISFIMISATIALIGSFLINLLLFKISLHTVGFGFLVGIILFLIPVASINLFPILIIAVLIAGLVGTARLYLSEHRGIEVYSGYALGLFSVMIAIQIVLLFVPLEEII